MNTTEQEKDILTARRAKSCAKLAKFGNAAILAFEKASNHGGKVERPWALCDLLADLMHWADAKGFDFENDLRMAGDHYRVEKLGEGNTSPLSEPYDGTVCTINIDWGVDGCHVVTGMDASGNTVFNGVFPGRGEESRASAIQLARLMSQASGGIEVTGPPELRDHVTNQKA